MKKFIALLFLLALVQLKASAQNDAPHRIAVFAPLYLDSAFDASDEYRYSGNNMPKFIGPGLEFYEGVQLALDSLEKERVRLEVFIYDTRSAKQTLEQQLDKAARDKVELILAHCSTNEVKIFADKALETNIPVINTTIPNEGGTTGNPFFVVLNPTLRTQCEGIYNYVKKYYAGKRVVVFRKKGRLEDGIKSYWEDAAKLQAGTALKIKYVDLPDSFTVNQLRPHLDTTVQTVCLAGTLDINFGSRLIKQLASLNKKYRSVVIGMPTWESLRSDFNKAEYKGLEIIFSTPFYNPRQDKASRSIITHFNTRMFSRPSDMVFRGYETTWNFGRLLVKYGKDLASNLGNKQYSLFTDFDLQPVLDRSSLTLDYFENKKLYFLKYLDGSIKSVN
ncbi:ABC transporter substrate-binding protein [Nostoc ellipsosporum NOK]|nr:ABC transporter substrate-binding protein [Nostoc ellipsosporum NOK]